MQMRRELKWVVLSAILSSSLQACSTYRAAPPEQADTVGARYLESSAEGLSLRLIPLAAPEAKTYLGIDSDGDKMLPVLVILGNQREAPIRIDGEWMSVTMRDGANCGSLPIETAISRAHRDGSTDAVMVVSTLAFGIPGVIATATVSESTTNVNRTLEEDYHAKKLQPAIVLAGSEARGVIFFDLKGCSDSDPATLKLRFTDLQSNTAVRSDIDLLDPDKWHQREVAEVEGDEAGGAP